MSNKNNSSNEYSGGMVEYIIVLSIVAVVLFFGFRVLIGGNLSTFNEKIDIIQPAKDGMAEQKEEKPVVEPLAPSEVITK